MIRLVIFLIQISIIIGIVSIVISNTFVVSFDIGEYQYSFSSNLFFSLIAFLLVILYIIQYIFFKTRFSFQKYLFVKKYKRLQKGYNYFVDAMIAIANKDNKLAISSNNKMTNYLKEDPGLSLLLKSEVLKIEKKYDQLASIYEEMIKRKNTETLGYRGLMEHNLRNQDFHHAFIYGEKLFSLNPRIEKLYETLIQIIAKTKNWNQLIFISDKAYSSRIIETQVANENKSIAFYEIAKIKMHSDVKDSLKFIQKALGLKKNFPPYIKLYLEILLLNQNFSQIKKIIKKFWIDKPSSSLRNVITEVLKNNNLNDIDFIKSLVDKNINNEESKKLLIDFAIYLNHWQLARNNIKGLIGTNPTREICIFMADIEMGEFNDKQKSEAWKLRGQNAELENYWICKITNISQKNWTTMSESGYFNSLEWRRPKMINQELYTK